MLYEVITYPEWAFENKGMYPYGYQNGGDWTWFGGRMIQQLIKYGFVQEAYEQMQPMVKRVITSYSIHYTKLYDAFVLECPFRIRRIHGQSDRSGPRSFHIFNHFVE